VSLTDEQQAYLDVMQIAGFPVKVENGLFMWNEAEAKFPPRMGMNSRTHATADISNVVSMFEFWKRHKYNEL
jgi:hypothetical protein